MAVVADGPSAGVASLLATEIEQATGWRVNRTAANSEHSKGIVRLRVKPGPENGPAAEGYRLTVGATGIEVVAPSPAGVFYGTRTLRQLLPPDLLRAAPARVVGSVDVEGVEIEDAPRFGWRGISLDVSRHFFPKSFILKLVDAASLHKLNTLHLHLTDDQGWRVQIDRYPRLTEIGAWRRESPLGHYREGRKDGTPHGGFYTKADLAEIVSYAARRFVTVVPEIDMPGHMQAAIAAYPGLGNTAETLEVFTEWGISEHVLNLEEPTVRFCAEVLEEVMDIFPGPFVHIGGDECPTTEWCASSRARQLCETLGLAGPGELQRWFTARMSEVTSARGRSLVGWDEVLDAGAPPGCLIMAWRAEHAHRVALEAAKAGHEVVMAPEPWTYFDWAYADDPAEPLAIRPAISVEHVYGFEPVPEGLPAELQERIVGTQCQLWSEYVTTPAHAEYMYFPRACALAEVAWSGRGRRWDEFEGRLREHLGLLDALGINYRPLCGPTPGQARAWLPARSRPDSQGVSSSQGMSSTT
jgi:hexosaminidase